MELLPDAPMAGQGIGMRDQGRGMSAEVHSTADHAPAVTEQAPLTTPRTAQPARPPSARPSASPAPSAPLTVAAIAGMWPEMTQRVGRHTKNLPALLTMCKPLAIEGHTIVLGFDYPLLQDKFDKTAGALELVTDTFGALGATDSAVRTVTTSDYPVPIPREEVQALADELGGVVREE